jgi:nucleotide-binding universal stress UspA family protein
MILIAYDGSQHGREAIRAAARLARGPATVLHVHCQAPRMPLATDAAMGVALDQEVWAQRDRRLREQAEATAQEGAQLAREAGLEAEPLVVEELSRRVWRAIVDVADGCAAELVVLGRRGSHGLRTSLPGSISRGVMAHCSRPVLVVTAEKPAHHYTSEAALKAFAEVAEHTSHDHHDEAERLAHQEAARRAGANPRRGVSAR